MNLSILTTTQFVLSMYLTFIFSAQISVFMLAIFVQSTFGQNRRQNYVPRGDISNDRDLEEVDSKNGTSQPRTTPEVLSLLVHF